MKNNKETANQLWRSFIVGAVALGTVVLANRSSVLSLSDRQMHLVQTAARSVPVAKRDELLTKIASHLAPNPSDAAVEEVLNIQLNLITPLVGEMK
jgi:hypothetical protein